MSARGQTGFRLMARDSTALNLVGAGGHASVVADMARCLGFAEVVLWSDDKADLARFPAGCSWRPLSELDATQPVMLALGDIETRATMRRRFPVHAAALIDASAILGHGVTVGKGTAVMPGCVLNANATVGDDCILNSGCIVEHDCVIGANTHLSPAAALGGGVKIGAGAHVGLGAAVLPGVTIGNGAVVGAGAVVISDVAAGKTVVGVPAREISR